MIGLRSTFILLLALEANSIMHNCRGACRGDLHLYAVGQCPMKLNCNYKALCPCTCWNISTAENFTDRC